MNSQLEIYYWQKLAGIITESQYYEKKRLLEVSIEQLKTQFVDTDKVPQEVFDAILDAVNSDSAYATWLTSRVAKNLIKAEDVSNFGEYIQIFDKNKRSFDKADINQYKTANDIADFKNQAIKVREKDIEITGTPSDDKPDSKPSGLVTKNEVAKLENVGIKFMGIVDGYQVFKVPQSLRGNEEAYKTYATILGRCAGRDQGAKIELCTVASKDYFDQYLGTDDLYVFFNMSDPDSPYQFHYAENQFMDRKDDSIA